MRPRSVKKHGTGNATILQPEAPFTADELRSAFDQTKNGKWNTPAEREIEKFASILTVWKRFFYAAQQAGALNKKLAEAEKAILTLYDLMPAIYELRARAAEAGDPFSKPMAEAAKGLLLALGCHNNIPGYKPAVLACVHREPLPESVKDWRWLIRVLPSDFESMLRPANPGVEIGSSKAGPFARFLEYIIPHITGERPTASAIGTQLILAKTKSGDIDR